MTTQLKLRKELPARLRSLGLDEAWLQREIANDTSLLGLGELEIVKKEKILGAGGRIDFVMADAEGETRYEIELMLGAVDESHIIRTIEYWDVERQRYSMFEHQAVIVAEEITARFFNVIRLLNRSVPLIAIQLSAFRIGDEVVLHFTRVLGANEFSAEPEDEENTEQVDLVYWQKKAHPDSLAVVEALRKLTPTTKGEARITYNKHHIALGTTGYNFCWFHPRRKPYSHVNIKTGADKRPEIIKKLQDQGLEAGSHRSGSIHVHLTTKDIHDHLDLITEIMLGAEELSHR